MINCENKQRVLIGSCGGLTGSYLVRQFKKKGYYVIGADGSPDVVTKFFADEFVILPRLQDENSLTALIEILKKYKVDYYFPTHSNETKFVAQYEDALRSKWDGKFTVSPYCTFLQLDDKRRCNENLAKAGLPVPNIYHNLPDDDQYPIFMKRNVGSGSAGALIIDNRNIHQAFMLEKEDNCFYQLINGTEYTVDCLFDTNGKLVGYNQRKRVKNIGGAVIITQNDYCFDISPYLMQLEKQFIFKGCVNFQYILQNGIPYFIDVNLRYASGGLPLTVESGIDIPQLMISILNGESVTGIKSCAAPNKTMYRYFEERFE